jgi:uncharacterized membrane protein YbhN (UPF0104 family)
MNIRFSPRVIVPLVIGLGIIAVLLGYANAGQVMLALSTFQPIYLVAIALVQVGYEILRALQWLGFLSAIERNVPRRTALMSFMGGEMAKMLPAGQYFQTYLLREAGGIPIARSAAATSIIIWLEVMVCAVVLLMLGLVHWAWVRPAALVILIAIALLISVLIRRPLSARLFTLARRYAPLLAAWTWYDTFATSASTLLRPRALLPALAFSAAYIVCAAMGLWAIAGALGISAIGPREALVVYCFALIIGLVVPIPIDLGLTELSGLAALIAFGVNRADALTIMLLQRVLSSVLTIGIAGISLTVLRRSMAGMLRRDGTRPAVMDQTLESSAFTDPAGEFVVQRDDVPLS